MSASCEESSECEEIEVFGLSPVLLDSNFNELPRYGSTPTIAAILRLLVLTDSKKQCLLTLGFH
jgi:hypothetical protein